MNPNTPTPDQEVPPSTFSQLVIMLATSALQLMGRMPNPATGRAEAHLEDAQATIDVIEMLAEKTKGNLDAQEERFLGETLTSLRMAYVNTAQSGAPAATPPPAESPPAPERGPAPEAPEAGEAAPDQPSTSEEKKPRFQKKYD
jgi:hypothetical protein